MEAAAALIAVEQVISTTIEGGAIGAYAVAQPTHPLKATFTQIASITGPPSPDSLRRYSHTIAVVAGKAYIFGGLTSSNALASNDIHIVPIPTLEHGSNRDYQCIPSLATTEDGQVPASRANHTACVSGDMMIIYGGAGADGKPVDEPGTIWVFDTSTLRWSRQVVPQGAPSTGSKHAAAIYKSKLVIHGGQESESEASTETWIFEMPSGPWTKLPMPHVSKPVAPPSLALDGEKLCLVSGAGGLSLEVHTLDLADSKPNWNMITIPNNPLIPGPQPRTKSALIPVTTGYGRHFLLYLLGQKDGASELLDDLWTFQITSDNKTMASAKDTTREKVGVDSGEYTWAEVENAKETKEDSKATEKTRPGPLADFACANITGKSILIWGGINTTGDAVGDAWVVDLA